MIKESACSSSVERIEHFWEKINQKLLMEKKLEKAFYFVFFFQKANFHGFSDVFLVFRLEFHEIQ